MDKCLVFCKLLKTFLKQISMDERFHPRDSKSCCAQKNQFTKPGYCSVEVIYRKKNQLYRSSKENTKILYQFTPTLGLRPVLLQTLKGFTNQTFDYNQIFSMPLQATMSTLQAPPNSTNNLSLILRPKYSLSLSLLTCTNNICLIENVF